MTLVAGHGRNYSLEELRKYREMIAHTVDIVRNEMLEGKQLEEIKMEHPLADWSKDWTRQRDTSDNWVETIYRSLKPLGGSSR